MRDQAGMDPETFEILDRRAREHEESWRAAHPMPLMDVGEMRARMRAADPTADLDDPTADLDDLPLPLLQISDLILSLFGWEYWSTAPKGPWVVFKLIDDVVRAVESINPDAMPVRERRRHGTAAVCPQHGPTRGGTCWKCRR